MATATHDRNSAEAAVSGAIDGVKESVRDTYEGSKTRVHDGIENAKHKMSDGVESAKTAVADGYEKVAEKARHAWDAASDTSLNEAEANAVRYIRHNPGRSLLIAGGAGLLIGLFLRGRAS